MIKSGQDGLKQSFGTLSRINIKKSVQTVKKAPLSEETAKKTVYLLGYLENNKNKLNYLQYKSEDLYIGSGMIEGGNKVVIQKRMKQCGMRWSVNGGQYIAALRAKDKSKKWNVVEDTIYNRSAA